MYLDGKWYGLQLSPDATLPVGNVALLDVSILQDRLLDPILGIHDVRTDKRIDFVGGLRGTKELERLVDEGKAAVAFSLHPTTIEELLMVSDAGEIMPPKSTWFEPKLRDGLLIHRLPAKSLSATLRGFTARGNAASCETNVNLGNDATLVAFRHALAGSSPTLARKLAYEAWGSCLACRGQEGIGNEAES